MKILDTDGNFTKNPMDKCNMSRALKAGITYVETLDVDALDVDTVFTEIPLDWGSVSKAPETVITFVKALFMANDLAKIYLGFAVAIILI